MYYEMTQLESCQIVILLLCDNEHRYCMNKLSIKFNHLQQSSLNDSIRSDTIKLHQIVHNITVSKVLFFKNG